MSTCTCLCIHHPKSNQMSKKRKGHNQILERTDSSNSQISGSNSSQGSQASSCEGTFINLHRTPSEDSVWEAPKFVNPRFEETEDEDDLLVLTDIEREDKVPLQLLFPELDKNFGKNIRSRHQSTTEVVKMLAGKKADFSLLRPSRKLSAIPQIQGKMSPLMEVINEDQSLASFNPQKDDD